MPTMNFESAESNKIQIRPFVMDDMNKVIALRLEARQAEPHIFPRSYEKEAATSNEAWLERFEKTRGANPTSLLELAWNGDELIGMAGARQVEPGKWDLHGVYVRMLQRGNKTGPKLVKELMRKIKLRGDVRRIEFNALVGNDRAVHMYQELGFTIVGTERSKMGDGREHGKFIFRMDL